MNDQPLVPKVGDLQVDVLRVLEKFGIALDLANEALEKVLGSKPYHEIERSISEEYHKVKRLELVMSIVAPMKAGKSTIINAIIGQDLLPSRNAAMTSVPTEIVLDTKQEIPLLQVPKSLAQACSKATQSIRASWRRCNENEREEKIGRYPHLRNLLEDILQPGNQILIRESVRGRKSIAATLETINDIIRLAELFARDHNPIYFMSEVPRIVTSYWRQQDLNSNRLLGNLVIVDTPGPNEAGASGLTRIVKEQLNRSSLVLVVLDFTGLKTLAAESVKEEVGKVISLRGGQDSLRVLVNKIDQRRDKDMTSKELHEFVRTEMGIDSGNAEERVHEISARWAFASIRYMQAVAESQDASFSSLPEAIALAKELYPTDWEEELADMTKDRMERKAISLWNQSGFGEFLEKSIKVLMDEAAPSAIRAALTLMQSYLSDMQGDLALRVNSLSSDFQKIDEEIRALEGDLESLLQKQRSLKETIEDQKRRLEREVWGKLNDLASSAVVNIEGVFNVLGVPSGNEKTNLQASRVIPAFLRSILSKFKDQRIEVASKEEAERIRVDAEVFANETVDMLLDRTIPIMNTIFDKGTKSVITEIRKETKPIVASAQKRLNETFDVNIELPQFDPDRYVGSRILPEKAIVDEHIVSIDQGYATVKKRRWFVLWLFEVDTKVKLPDRQETRYSYPVKDLVVNINKSIYANIDLLKVRASDFVSHELQIRVDAFYRDLDSYLRGYQSSLRETCKVQKTSAEQKQAVIDVLQDIVPKVEEIRSEIEILSRRSSILGKVTQATAGGI